MHMFFREKAYLRFLNLSVPSREDFPDKLDQIIHLLVVNALAQIHH